MKKTKDTILKIIRYVEYACFSLSIILQNFALFRTDKFGIAASTCVIIYFFIRYRLFKYLTVKFIAFLGFIVLFFLVNGLLNSSLNVMQILRTLMIIFDVWVTFVYAKSLSENERNTFVKIFTFCYAAMCVYGLYEYYAQSHGLPRYLNYLSNNPSYGIRSPFSVNEGWSKSARIFTCFFEPSVFSVFLVYGYVFIYKNFKRDTRAKKTIFIILTMLSIVVLVLSSARTGFLYLAYIVLAIIVNRFFGKKPKAVFLAKCFFVSLPIVTLFGSYYLGSSIFNDLSVSGRTSSSLYYTESTFESPHAVIFGHGSGSLVAEKNGVYVDGIKIENHAHNGYVEVAYQYGIIAVVLFIYCIIRVIERAPEKDRLLLYALIFSLACTGELYTVETLAVITALIYSFSFSPSKLKAGVKR